MAFEHDIEEEVLVLTKEQEEESRKIVLFNDEVNTFDWVIDSLVEVCRHEPVQAEQCTLIVHFKGKCDVKEGDWETLEPMCTALLDRGLTAEIQ
ncbi:MAG: ATP-dependent Clp protease adaptor ClpS [Flavobacteriales bacterium]